MAGFLVVSLISILTTAAALALTRAGRDSLKYSVMAPGLAAGVMLWLAVFEVGPQAAASLGWPTTLVAMSLGGGLVWVSSRLAHRVVAPGIAPVVGVALMLHDLPEGFAVGAVITAAGLAASLPIVVAVAAHNLPEKLAFMAPASMERARLAPVLVAATLPEPLGAALAAAGAAAAPGLVSAALATAGGMMLAVAVGALPTVARRASSMGPFLRASAMGAAAMALLGAALPA